MKVQLENALKGHESWVYVRNALKNEGASPEFVEQFECFAKLCAASKSHHNSVLVIYHVFKDNPDQAFKILKQNTVI